MIKIKNNIPLGACRTVSISTNMYWYVVKYIQIGYLISRITLSAFQYKNERHMQEMRTYSIMQIIMTQMLEASES